MRPWEKRGPGEKGTGRKGDRAERERERGEKEREGGGGGGGKIEREREEEEKKGEEKGKIDRSKVALE
jgi:hypothetical protein